MRTKKAKYGITVSQKVAAKVKHSRQAREDISKLYSFRNIKSLFNINCNRRLTEV